MICQTCQEIQCECDPPFVEPPNPIVKAADDLAKAASNTIANQKHVDQVLIDALAAYEKVRRTE